MCGICGIYNYNKERYIDEKLIMQMEDAIAHRGPDGRGRYVNEFIGLGHVRLSIIDLAGGSQPISNENKTMWIIFNGEIYNYKAIRKDLRLKGHQFSTDSDTEVIIHAYEEYGTDCVHQLNGMFAFAIWDSRQDTLFLARDRIGIKPLYYAMVDGNFIFGSEIKAILKHPLMDAKVELKAIPEYLFSTVLLDDHTMFKDIKTLQAGHTLLVKNKHVFVNNYWDLVLGDDEEKAFEVYQDDSYKLLHRSIQERLMSDVPLGTLLSGGLDSSLVSAITANSLSHKLRTFSMEFVKNNEMKSRNSDTYYASIVAEQFKTHHQEYALETDAYHRQLEHVIWHVEKPVELTAPSLYLLFKQLKKDVSVVLSGEGADEIFGGYFFFLKHKGKPSEFPWAPYYQQVSSLLKPEINQKTHYQERIETTINDMYKRHQTHDDMNKQLYLFIKLYLVEMLERQDKTSMAWGVESRVPFLDHRLVEYVVNMPSRYKIHNGIEKYILKEASRRILPQEVIDRKKKPCPFPIDPMTLHRNKNKAKELIASGNSKIAQYFDKTKVNHLLDRKEQYKNIDSLAIFRTSFSLISLEKWHRAFGV